MKMFLIICSLIVLWMISVVSAPVNGTNDTCSCPGLNQNWEIDMSDNCDIESNCNLGTGKLSFTGVGFTNCNAVVDTSDLGDPGNGGILYIESGCIINIA